MSHKPHKTPQVAILLPSSVKICRDIRRGILKYVHQHGPWGLHILEGRDGEQKLTNRGIPFTGLTTTSCMSMIVNCPPKAQYMETSPLKGIPLYGYPLDCGDHKM